MGTINKLTALEVKNQTVEGMYNDGGGLYLKVGPTGGQSWIYRYSLSGKKKKIGLGPYPAISLTEARTKAVEYFRLAHGGIDPQEHRKQLKQSQAAADAKSKTFGECTESYIASHMSGWKNKKTGPQWRSSLQTYAYPIIGKLSIQDVTTALVIEVLEPIWHTKNETASRVRGRIETIWNSAKTLGYVEGQNPAAWRGHLGNLLPSRTSVQKVRHHPALDYRKMGEFMAELRNRETHSAKGLEFLILTAARTSEVLEATWDEIDGDVWAIPAERMKMERPHRVPLSAQALSILKYMKPIRNSEYIFPGIKKDRPMSNMTFLKLLERMGHGDLTAHGFRSSFRDWIGETTAYQNEVAELALAHVIANKAEASYRRDVMLDKRVRLMKDWADYCNRTQEITDNVQPIRGT